MAYFSAFRTASVKLRTVFNNAPYSGQKYPTEKSNWCDDLETLQSTGYESINDTRELPTAVDTCHALEKDLSTSDESFPQLANATIVRCNAILDAQMRRWEDAMINAHEETAGPLLLDGHSESEIVSNKYLNPSVDNLAPPTTNFVTKTDDTVLYNQKHNQKQRDEYISSTTIPTTQTNQSTRSNTRNQTSEYDASKNKYISSQWASIQNGLTLSSNSHKGRTSCTSSIHNHQTSKSSMQYDTTIQESISQTIDTNHPDRMFQESYTTSIFTKKGKTITDTLIDNHHDDEYITYDNTAISNTTATLYETTSMNKQIDDEKEHVSYETASMNKHHKDNEKEHTLYETTSMNKQIDDEKEHTLYETTSMNKQIDDEKEHVSHDIASIHKHKDDQKEHVSYDIASIHKHKDNEKELTSHDIASIHKHKDNEKEHTSHDIASMNDDENEYHVHDFTSMYNLNDDKNDGFIPVRSHKHHHVHSTKNKHSFTNSSQTLSKLQSIVQLAQKELVLSGKSVSARVIRFTKRGEAILKFVGDSAWFTLHGKLRCKETKYINDQAECLVKIMAITPRPYSHTNSTTHNPAHDDVYWNVDCVLSKSPVNKENDSTTKSLAQGLPTEQTLLVHDKIMKKSENGKDSLVPPSNVSNDQPENKKAMNPMNDSLIEPSNVSDDQLENAAAGTYVSDDQLEDVAAGTYVSYDQLENATGTSMSSETTENNVSNVKEAHSAIKCDDIHETISMHETIDATNTSQSPQCTTTHSLSFRVGNVLIPLRQLPPKSISAVHISEHSDNCSYISDTPNKLNTDQPSDVRHVAVISKHPASKTSTQSSICQHMTQPNSTKTPASMPLPSSESMHQPITQSTHINRATSKHQPITQSTHINIATSMHQNSSRPIETSTTLSNDSIRVQLAHPTSIHAITAKRMTKGRLNPAVSAFVPGSRRTETPETRYIGYSPNTSSMHILPFAQYCPRMARFNTASFQGYPSTSRNAQNNN